MPRMRRRWLAGLVLGTATLPSARVAAQDTRELERRVDAAVSQRDDAVAALAAYRQRQVAPRGHPDTVVILDGAFRVITNHEFLSIAREAGALADSFVRRRAGAQTALLRGTVVAVWTDPVRRAEQGLVVSSRVDGRDTDVRYVNANVISVTRMLEEHAQWLLGTRGKPRLELWLAGRLPIDSATSSDWRALRLELVSSGTTVARRCYAGDLSACKATLGLIDEADPATAWYDSASRRALVEGARKSTRFDSRGASACVAGSDAECLTVLRTSWASGSWASPPGSGRARMALVQQSFAMGGPGALARLAASADTPADAVSEIAGAPIDSVVAHWQRLAHNGGIESEMATPVVALAAIGWILVMGALSLRSSRWR